MIDWNLKTNLEGLYAAGTATFAGANHSVAAANGRYAGRKAAEYALSTKPHIERKQVDKEKVLCSG